MDLLNGVFKIHGVVLQLLVVFIVIFFGYLIGKIKIKGVSLQTAGVFIAALLVGAIFAENTTEEMKQSVGDITSSAFKIIESLGLILFVGSVGIMAGSSFFRNFRKNFKSYLIIGVVIILIGFVTSIACYFIGLNTVQIPADAANQGITENQYMISMITGIMSGSLTSTPAFSAAQATAASMVPVNAASTIQDVVTIGHAVAYIFGVIGVVLFVQLIPRILQADMAKEREYIVTAAASSKTDQEEKKGKKEKKERFRIDDLGLAAFGFVVIVGILLGMIRIPLSDKGFAGTCFSLTITGGVLISGLVFAHFGHIGPISLKVKKSVLETFREFGLVLFLVGAGIPGGASFAKYFHPVYFLFGILITIMPLIIGYFIAKKLLKLSMLDNLGAITGGMTSTPALGALIRTAGTDDVASSYASTYPIALICVVLASQFLIMIFGGA